jgi:hypothetical protein
MNAIMRSMRASAPRIEPATAPAEILCPNFSLGEPELVKLASAAFVVWEAEGTEATDPLMVELDALVVKEGEDERDEVEDALLLESLDVAPADVAVAVLEFPPSPT